MTGQEKDPYFPIYFSIIFYLTFINDQNFLNIGQNATKPASLKRPLHTSTLPRTHHFTLNSTLYLDIVTKADFWTDCLQASVS